MHRFYVPPQQWNPEHPVLAGDEARHFIVRRIQSNEHVTLFDGLGHEILAELESIGKKNITLRTLKQNFIPPPQPQLILAPCLLPRNAMEFVIEKATELGASRITPLLTQRTLARDNKTAAPERWRKISIEAAKQCGASWLPVFDAAQPFANFLRATTTELKLIAALQPRAYSLRKALENFKSHHHRSPSSVIVAIGPEGDFTDDEVRAAEQAGFQPISLGALTLRSETAALYALSVLNDALRM